MIKTNILKLLSKIYKKASNSVYIDVMPNCIYDRTMANHMVYELLCSGKPAMISRFGSIELSIANTVRIQSNQGSLSSKLIDYIRDKTDLPWMDEKFYLPIERNAGVFSPTAEVLEKFGQLYVDDSKLIDLLMSINYKERHMPLSSSCKFIHFESIYPFWVDNPWTRVLEGKKVLVIYPFANSITSQYSRKDLLFENKKILPDFELIAYKPVQSAAYEKVEFKTWFDALNHMKDEISAIDFDVSILGCGAYGLPLAAHIKRMGKQAVHMGGGTQLLFGIKGGRWEDPDYTWSYNTPQKLNVNYRDLFNSHWIRPSKSEVPSRAKEVENACYW